MADMTASEYNKTRKAQGTKRIVGAKPIVVDGIKFPSQREAARWQDLRLLEIANHISNLKRQVPFPLNGQDGPVKTPTGKQMFYLADFTYRDSRLNGALVVEDAKGWPTEVYKIKKAILAAQGVEVKEV